MKYTINKVLPNVSEKDLQAIIAFRKRFFKQAYPNDEIPNFDIWGEVIEQAYKNRRGFAFYNVLADGQVVANIRHIEPEEGKRVLIIDHDRTHEMNGLHKVLCKHINASKGDKDSASIGSRRAFMDKVLAECDFVKGNQTTHASLHLAGLNTELLEKWTQTLPPDISCSFMSDPTKEECAEIAEIMTFLLNDMERHDRTIDFNITEEEQYKIIQRLHESGHTISHLVLRNKQGKMIGISVVIYKLESSKIGWQKMTGILPEYRRQGLARFLKARLYEYIIENEPELKVIKTDYFTDNYKISALNKKMGIEEDYHEQHWYFKL